MVDAEFPNSLNTENLVKAGMAHHQAGRLGEAEATYRRVLNGEPYHPEALHLLGMIQFQRGRLDDATKYVEQAIATSPHAPSYRNSHGLIRMRQGRLPEAVIAFRESVRLNEDVGEVWANLAQAFDQSGSQGEAAEAYRRAVELAKGKQKADLHMRQGHLLQRMGKLEEAADCYRAIIAIDPQHAGAHANLASVLGDLGNHVEAEAAFVKADQLGPNDSSLHNNWGVLLHDRQQLEAAARHFRRALELRPNYAGAANNLAAVLREQGQTAAAVDLYRRALSIQPGWAQVHSNLLMTLHYDPRYSPEYIAEEHRRWAQQHAQPLARHIRPHSNNTDPHRRLRVGYVSHDFREHAVASFLLPVLGAHDHQQFEVICYANLNREDAVTAQFKTLADQWRNISALNDDQVADLIREDAIDILVDVGGHTGMNRLLVFARKPAPVQVTWLGYPDTTGLSTIDYRLTDAIADPPGLTEHLHSERLIRLDPPFLCYQPPPIAPEVGPLPALRNGYVTFGSFNAASKLSDFVLDLWAQILAAQPNSRLLLKAKGLEDETCRNRISAALARRGVTNGRITVLGHVPTPREHLESYRRVDIALDSFPYHGTTTTCEAMWMGLPVITLAGTTHVSRVGTSILQATGLTRFVAMDVSGYVGIATAMTRDMTTIAEMRRMMRRLMVGSPLVASEAFTQKIESMFRRAWKTWCKGNTSLIR